VCFNFGALLFLGRTDDESALGSPALEPDSQSGGFCNVCPHFETHPFDMTQSEGFTHLCYNKVLSLAKKLIFAPKGIFSMVNPPGAISSRHASNVKEALHQMTFGVCR